jgi:hypothetical protein
MKKSLNIIVVLYLLNSGCMSYDRDKLSEVKNPMHQAGKPVIEIVVGNWPQKSDEKDSPVEVSSDKNNGYLVLKAILNLWYEKDLISVYGTKEDLGKNKPDFTLTLNGFRNEDKSWFEGVLHRLSVFAVPSSRTTELNLDLILKNTKTNEEYIVDAENSSTMWSQLVLIIGFPVFWLGNYDMQNETSMYIYYRFNEQGAFAEYYSK